MLSEEEQIKLRYLYDNKVNKNAAARQTGLAEATVYRYYTKWSALTSATAFDLTHLKPSVVREYEIQARMRQMSVYALIFELLNTIYTDNMFKAIVDMPENHPSKHRLNDDHA